MDKKYIFIGLGVIILAVIATIVVVVVRNKKNNDTQILDWINS